VNPAIHHLARTAKRLATGVALRHPRAGLRLAGLVGPWSALNPRTGRAPAAEDLLELLGPMSARRLQSIRRAIAAQEYRSEMMINVVVRFGYAPLIDLITTVHSEPLRQLRAQGVPVIAVGLHMGPFRALPIALEKEAIPSLVAIWEVIGNSGADGRFVRHANLTSDTTAMQSGVKSTLFLKRAHHALAEGVVVGIQIDQAGGKETTTLFGRDVSVGRSAVSLARLTGARLVPVTSRFVGSGGNIEVVFHQPIADADLDRGQAGNFERVLLGRAASFFEARMVEHPELLRPQRVRMILASPRANLRRDPTTEGPSLPRRQDDRRARRLSRKRASKRAEWEQLWGRSDFDAHWLRRGICAELQEAVDSGWFPPGGRALDAGCGEGDTAAWLASRGYETVGVDIAVAAIERAREKNGETAGLRFERCDLCAESPSGGPFDLVVDRGCYHQIDEEEQRGYGRRLASLCVPGAPLLLFARAFGDGVPVGDPLERSKKWQELMYAFGPYFRLERSALTYLDRFGGQKPGHAAPGLAYWLRRYDTQRD